MYPQYNNNMIKNKQEKGSILGAVLLGQRHKEEGDGDV
jgi:hypothetical protein